MTLAILILAVGCCVAYAFHPLMRRGSHTYSQVIRSDRR